MSKRKYSGVNVNDGGDHKKIKIKASKAEDDCKPENDLKNTRIEDSKSNEHTSVENENNETSMFARKAKRRGNPNGQGKTARKKSLVNGSSVLVQDKLASKPVGRKVKADRRRKKGETKREEFSGETSKTNENSVVLDQENIASRLTERKPEGEWKEAPTKREEEQKEPVGENSNPEGGPSTVNEDKAARRVLSRSTKIDRKKKRKRAKLMEREMEREEQQNKPVDKKPTEKKAMKKEPVGDNSNVNGDPSGVIEDKVARKLALRKAKIERRRTKKAQEGELKIVTNDASKAQANSGQRKSKDKNKKRKTNSEENAHSWNISDPIGGQMMDLDPIFALNEE